MNPNNHNLTKFKDSKSFYRSFKSVPDLHWISYSFLDKELNGCGDAIETWDYVKKYIFFFRLVRMLVIMLSIIGLGSCCVLGTWGIYTLTINKIITNNNLASGFVLAGFVVCLTACYWVFREGIQFSDSLLDAWIQKNWVTADFQETLLTIGKLGQKSEYEVPRWMIPNGNEQIHSKNPQHVVSTVNDNMYHIAAEVRDGQVIMDNDFKKLRLKKLLLASKRLRIVDKETDIRVYYRVPGTLYDK